MQKSKRFIIKLQKVLPMFFCYNVLNVSVYIQIKYIVKISIMKNIINYMVNKTCSFLLCITFVRNRKHSHSDILFKIYFIHNLPNPSHFKTYF